MTKYRWRMIFFTAIAAFFMFGLGMSGCGGDQEQTERQDVQQDAQDTAQTATEYAGEQKDEMLAEAEVALDNADEQIEELGAQIEDKWDEMDADAREQANETLDTLKEKRQALANEIDDMKDSEDDVLGEIQEGFWDGYESAGGFPERCVAGD